MATQFDVEIVTPERIRFEGAATTLTLPGSTGEMGILSNHEPLVALLDPGLTRLASKDGTQVFATGEGFVQVRNNKATVIVEFAVIAEEIDKAAAENALSSAQAALRETLLTAEARQRKMCDVKAAQARLALLSDPTLNLRVVAAK